MNRAERVHVSLSELRTAASRALHGAGAPAGTERDGARSAVWLESRGLRGAAALVSELGAVAEAGYRPPSFAGNRVDLAGGPVLTWGSTLIETAMLTAGTAIVLAGCRIPRVLLPEAVVQAGHGWSFRLEAGGCEALVAAGETTVDRSFAELDAADVRLIAAEGPPNAPLSRRRLPAPGWQCWSSSRATPRRLRTDSGLSLTTGGRSATRRAGSSFPRPSDPARAERARRSTTTSSVLRSGQPGGRPAEGRWRR